jgi:hypothetical protein
VSQSTVVQRLRVVVLLLQSLLPHLAPTSLEAAEQQLCMTKIYERMLSHMLIEHSSKTSCDNSYCIWLYSLIFADACWGDSAHHAHGYGSCSRFHGRGSLEPLKARHPYLTACPPEAGSAESMQVILVLFITESQPFRSKPSRKGIRLQQ